MDKKLLLYGAGKVGQDYVMQLSRYNKREIVCWVDKEYEKISGKYREVIELESALDKDYDFILIEAERKELENEMEEFLLNKEIPEEKIVWYPPKTLF